MKNRAVFKFGLISKYRQVLMGCAIIGIVLCHLDIAQNHHESSTSHLAVFLHLFTVGVDIFMLLSGFGLYYSYSKRKISYGEYLKKRTAKLVPYYLVVAGITYFISTILIRRLGGIRFFEDLMFVSWWKYESTRYWFILGILLFYIVFPLIYRYLYGGGRNDGKTICLKLCVFIMLFLVVTGIIDACFPRYRVFRIAIERFPIFVVGCVLGKFSKEGKTAPVTSIAAIAAVGFITTGLQLVWHSYKVWVSNTHYLYYLTRGLFSFSIIFVAATIMEFLDARFEKVYKPIFSVLNYIGGITLKIYLLHQSCLILFDFPPKFLSYICSASILPIVAAWIWDKSRARIKGIAK